MLYNSSSLRFTLLVPLLLAGSLFFITACDSGGSSGGSTTLSGTVTDDGSASATTSSKSKAAVEGATVTAIKLNDDGSTTALDASATTGSDGSFTLTVDRQTDGATLIVKAEKDGANFSSSVGVQVTDPDATTAQPMTPETDAEAQVAQEINADGGSSEDAAEALADAAALVDNEVANAILSGNTSPQSIADVARSMDETKEQYAQDAGASVSEDDVANEEQKAYENLQKALANGQSQSSATKAFEDAMASSYKDAGATTEQQAEIEQSGTKVALTALDKLSLPSAAERGLKRRATILKAIATSASVENTVGNGNGNASTAQGNLEQARKTLLQNVRGASTINDIDNAVSTYRSKLESNIAEGFSASSSDVSNGLSNLDTALNTLNGALDQAISTTNGLSVSSDQVSKDFNNFYSNGLSTVKSVYEKGGMASGPAGAAAKATVQAKAF